MAHTKPLPFSIAILAGGQSRRMGRNKALLKLGGSPILQWVINTVQGLTDDLFLVTNTPQIYRPFNVPMTPDAIPGKAALGGIYSAILRARHEWVLVLACDMPLLNPNVITFLARRRQNFDVVAPLVTTHPETLHTYYRKTCLPAVEKQVHSGQLKITGFFEAVNVCYVTKKNLTTVTSNFDFLINLNTPQELQRLQKTIGRPDAPGLIIQKP
ncbi:MAG: molybdenum cofactor guanylyltransferase [Anaerolineae bacterium]